MNRSRMHTARAALGPLDALLVTSLPNIRYLAGFTGSYGLAVLTRSRRVLITDSRYREQSARESPGWRRIISAEGLFESAASSGVLRGCRRVGFESSSVSYAAYRSLRTTLPGIHLVPTRGIIEELALAKDGRELTLIRRAIRISERVFGELLNLMRPGMREREVAAEITFRQRMYGAERDSFEPIVASGPRSALPHARAGERKLRAGEPIIVDFGCAVGGYNSDITRTICLGRAPRRVREIHDILLDAHTSALDRVRPGMAAKEVDASARQRIVNAGYGKRFIHSLGHGLGLRVHEPPRIAPTSTETLCEGAVITIEPGIYLPGFGGVRIEDDVLVTGRGARLLTGLSRELFVL